MCGNPSNRSNTATRSFVNSVSAARLVNRRDDLLTYLPALSQARNSRRVCRMRSYRPRRVPRPRCAALVLRAKVVIGWTGGGAHGAATGGGATAGGAGGTSCAGAAGATGTATTGGIVFGGATTGRASGGGNTVSSTGVA